MITDYNGVDVNKRREYIEINASYTYIDQILTSHGWNDTFKQTTPDKPLLSMTEDSIDKILYTCHNTIEGSAANKDLEKKIVFSH